MLKFLAILAAWLASSAPGKAQGAASAVPMFPQESAIHASEKPYRSEAVRFENRGAGVTLAGTFSAPEGKGPFPTVILLAGSGPNDRDEVAALPGWAVSGHRKFLVLADALNRSGIAVLRYDKRGVGQSTGDYATASLSDFASDAEAAVRYLKTRADVAQDKIGLIGDSEGGFLAPILAARDPHIAYVVLLSTDALPFEQGALLQKAAIARAEGKSAADITAYDTLYRRIFAIVLAAKTPEEAREALTTAAAPLVSEGRFSQAEADAGISALTSPLGFELMRFDPRPYLRKLTIPVLVVTGALDTQVPPGENLAAMREALGGDRDVTILELPGINHQLQRAKTGAPSEYATIPETVDDVVLKSIDDWLGVHVREGGALGRRR